MGWWWKKVEPAAPAKPPEPTTITFYPGDDLVERAEKIVRMLGYSGAIGGLVLEVYNVLKIYEKIDREEAEYRASKEEKEDDTA